MYSYEDHQDIPANEKIKDEDRIFHANQSLYGTDPTKLEIYRCEEKEVTYNGKLQIGRDNDSSPWKIERCETDKDPKIGDIFMDINDTRIPNATHEETIAACNKNGFDGKLTIRTEEGDSDFNYIQFWRKQDHKYAIEIAKRDIGQCVYPETDRADPWKKKIEFFDSKKQYKFNWGDGCRQETANEMTHRVFRVIRAASQETSDIIMTSHCDLVYLFGAYPAFLKEEGNDKKTIYHDPARPHPKKKNFPCLGMDKILRKSTGSNSIKGSCCVAPKAGAFLCSSSSAVKSPEMNTLLPRT